ncbi:hypothetical protein NDU88_006940 [Pleurodeles waltl]|uniref:Uncharacterized protein n=1 Tax=Pleurodeles waltl TaxID=8319 RepID=A0AAV7WC64_PLEWA|nr:hypothetical protein NDU88_006940 [Pleurodeles waltl]
MCWKELLPILNRYLLGKHCPDALLVHLRENDMVMEKGLAVLEDSATSENFWVHDDAGGQEQETDGVSEEEERDRGDMGRQQQEESSNPRKEDDAEEQRDSERQEENKSNAREERDAEEQEQEGRGDARKEKDRESRGRGEWPRSGEGREEPNTRKPCYAPKGMGCTRYDPIFLHDLPLG